MSARFIAALVLLAACTPTETPTTVADAGSFQDGHVEGGASTPGPGASEEVTDSTLASALEYAINEDTKRADYRIRLGAVETVYESPPSIPFGSFPFALSLAPSSVTDDPRVLVSFAQYPDAATGFELVSQLMISDDLGDSYQAVTGSTHTPLINATQLQDGDLLSLAFIPEFIRDDNDKRASATMDLFRSKDRGQTWTKAQATFDPIDVSGKQRFLSGLRFHRGMIEIPSGPDQGVLLVGAYLLYSGDSERTIILAASRDGGLSWKPWGNIAGTDRARNEATFAYAVNGDLVAVIRTHEDGQLAPLEICRSTDNGRTFSRPKPIEIAFEGEAALPRIGVNPHLALLPNGVLALVGGRNDNWVALSKDGLGQRWEHALITYVNHPVQSRVRGSSGYQSVVSVHGNRVFITGDNRKNCHDPDDSKCGGDGWTVDGKYRIWRRIAEVAPADRGRIDLGELLRSDRLQVHSSLTSARSDLGQHVLFDGSLAPDSKLTASADKAFVRLRFSEPRTLTRLGLANTRDARSNTRVYLLADGRWHGPVAATGETTDYAMRQFVLSTPLPVSEVYVQMRAQDSCEDACPLGLAELELYSTVNSFENESLSMVPRGYSDARMSWITRFETDKAGRALRIHDVKTNALGFIATTLPPGFKAGEASFRLRTIDLPNAFLFGLRGRGANGEGVRAFHFGVFPDGAIKQYQPDGWRDLFGVGVKPINLGQWQDVRLDATTATLRLSINGQHVVEVSPTESGATALERLYFSSAGTASVGDHVLVDDVEISARKP